MFASFSAFTVGHGKVSRPCDPGQPVWMGSVCRSREVQRYALPAFQQGRPSGKGLFSLKFSNKITFFFFLFLNIMCFWSIRLLTGPEQLTKTRDTQVSETAVRNVSPWWTYLGSGCLDLPQLKYVAVKMNGTQKCIAHHLYLFLFSDKYSSQFGGGSQYAYFHEEDETSFQLVDTAKTQKTAYQRNRMRFAQVEQIVTKSLI